MQALTVLGEAGQAKIAPATPQEQGTTNQLPGQQDNPGGFTPSQGLDVMQLFSQYWYIPAGLIGVFLAIGLAKRKKAV